MRRTTVTTVLLLMTWMVSDTRAKVGDGLDPHVRTESVSLRALLTIGSEQSLLIRSLVDRLNGSDVVVYVEYDMVIPAGIGGRVSFISKAGGRRYVRVRMAWHQPRYVQLAMLGHELQHAVEIAEADEIVDESSLAAFYARVGIVNSGDGTCFDSRIAIETGRRVLREIIMAAH